MTKTIRSLALGGLLAAFAAVPALAQNAPTPEGTTIRNVATATFTDANNNRYDAVNAEVSVTVGFLAGIDLKTTSTSLNPQGPSTGNQATFTVDNLGNGIDRFSLATTQPEGVTITGYMVNGVTYTTLAALNAALATMSVEAGGSINVTVVYDVASGTGGSDLVLRVTATSVRSNTTSDSQTVIITPLLQDQVNVTPTSALEQKLPSNTTPYTFVFTVTNNGNATETFNLSALSSNPTAVGVVLPTPSITLAAGASQTITLTYTVADVIAGTEANITLVATGERAATNTDQGTVLVRVVRPALSMTKEAFRNGGTTRITASDRVLPNEVIWYKISVTNEGTAHAAAVRISDQLPAQVVYVGANGDANGWNISLSGNTVTADLTGQMAGATTRFIWIEARVR